MNRNGLSDLSNKTWTDLWPESTANLRTTELQELDEAEFEKLINLIGRREAKTSGSQKRSKKVARQIKLKRRKEKRIPFTKKAMNYRYLECVNLNCIRPSRTSDWKPLPKRRVHATSVDCTNFSFIDEPVATMEAFEQLIAAECMSRGIRINFNDRYISDIGPYLLLGALRKNMTPVVLGGKISGSAKKVIEAVELKQFLQMGGFGKVKSNEVWPLPMRTRRGGGQSSPDANIAVQASRVERVADQTEKSVNEWLANLEPSEELTQAGSENLRTVVTEALNNAERHGRLGGDGEWVTAGFMARRNYLVSGQQEQFHVCNIGMMNIGRPISETIKEAPEEVRDQVSRYVQLHAGCGLSPETLATVFALQDGISRVDQSGPSPSGGTGMMDIVEFANGVGVSHDDGLDTRVAIVSGRSYIRFSGDFGVGIQDKTGRRLQWFNHENDVTTAPSTENVLDLPSAFPGTLVTFRFVIDRVNED